MSRLESTFTTSSFVRCVIPVSGILSWHPEELLSRFFEVYGGLSILLDLQKTLVGTAGYGRHLFFLRDFLLFPKTDAPVTHAERITGQFSYIGMPMDHEIILHQFPIELGLFR